MTNGRTRGILYNRLRDTNATVRNEINDQIDAINSLVGEIDGYLAGGLSVDDAEEVLSLRAALVRQRGQCEAELELYGASTS